MKTFEEWILEKDSEMVLDEGWKSGLAGVLGGAALTGALLWPGQHGQKNLPPPRPTIQQQVQTPQQDNKIRYNFGGPRKGTVDITVHDNYGEGTLKFLASQSLNQAANFRLAHQYITRSILKAGSTDSGTIRGLQHQVHQDGNWIIANFTWTSID